MCRGEVTIVSGERTVAAGVPSCTPQDIKSTTIYTEVSPGELPTNPTKRKKSAREGL